MVLFGIIFFKKREKGKRKRKEEFSFTMTDCDNTIAKERNSTRSKR